MTEREAFIEAIAADPNDGTVRLAFADWLQEHGEEDRAEFIRLGHEIASVRGSVPLHTTENEATQELRERAYDLFELRGTFWLEPFCRALGSDEHAASPRPDRWPQRVWKRWSREPRSAIYQCDCFQGDNVDLACWGSSPVANLDLWCGLVGHIRLAFGSPFPITHLPTAFALEPVRRLSITFTANAKQWKRLNVPCLARVRELRLELPPAPSRKETAAFDELAHSNHWSGLENLMLWSPNADGLATPSEYVVRLLRSPLLERVSALRGIIAVSDVPRLTRSPRTARLAALDLGGCNLPPGTGKLLCDASFRENLVALGLSLNHLEDDDMRALASVPWPKLRKLALGANELSDVGVQHLLPLVPQLTDLSLASGMITDAGAATLADAINPEHLRSLCLSYNPLSANTVNALRAKLGNRFLFTHS